MSDFTELSALRGLSPRQRRLLGLASMYYGGRYDTVTIDGADVPARDWDQDVDPATGAWIPASHRKPLVELGVTRSLVDRLVDLCVGRGRFPQITIDGPGSEEVAEALLEEGGLDLTAQADDHCVDLAVYGCACLGFHRPVMPDGSARWVAVQLSPEWCEPLTVAQAGGERARQLAEEMSAIGVQVDDGPALRTPAGARTDDLAFLRHQWPVSEEVAERTGGNSTQTTITWYRRDYTIDAIVEYEPVTVRAGDTSAPTFRALPVEPHGWGVVPLVWITSRGTRAGDTEGFSLCTGPVASLAGAADRSASYWTEGCQTVGAPPLVERDVDPVDQTAAILAGLGVPSADTVPAGSKAVLRYRSSMGTSGDVSLLELNGGGLSALKENVLSLVQFAYESARLTRPTAELMKGALSGTALERLHASDVGLAEGYRERLERGWRALARGLATALATVDGGVQPEQISVEMSWPRVFPYTAADVQEWAAALSVGVAAGFVSLETAVRRMAVLLEVEDTDAEVAAVTERDLAAVRALRDRPRQPVPPTAQPGVEE